MKTKSILIGLLTFFALGSCDNTNSEYMTVNVATPKFMTLEALRSSVEITEPTPIIESGKIYVYKDLVLVNDVDRGIHVIDNSNPENPKKVAFITIKANKDMEIKGDYLYVDSLMDLVVFNISEINNIKEVTRLKDVFPQYVIMPFVENMIVDYGDQVPNANEIIVSWTITEERRRIEEIDDLNTRFMNDLALAEANTSVGQGGSLARFKIVEDYLYAVDSHSINIFDINNLETPLALGGVYAGFDIETIFNRGDHLFLGSMSGMYIYDISSPAIPKYISEFQHGTACDPVVVDDAYAYITLRAGNFCGALDSSLLIVDIADLYNPKLKKSYSMDNPYGLGIKDNLLFICDGASGLKVYNKSNIENLELLDHFKDINTFDVIPLEDRLLMIGDKELFQYTYSDNGIDLLSKFSLN
jgi:hypothetical protein